MYIVFLNNKGYCKRVLEKLDIRGAHYIMDFDGFNPNDKTPILILYFRNRHEKNFEIGIYTGCLTTDLAKVDPIFT